MKLKKLRKRYKTLRIYECDYPNLVIIKTTHKLKSLSDALQLAINTTMDVKK